MMLDQHLSYALLQRLAGEIFFHGQFIVWIKVERELRKNPQFALYLDVCWRVDEGELLVPLLEAIVG